MTDYEDPHVYSHASAKAVAEVYAGQIAEVIMANRADPDPEITEIDLIEALLTTNMCGLLNQLSAGFTHLLAAQLDLNMRLERENEELRQALVELKAVHDA